MLQMSAGDFKAHCLRLMDLAQQKRETIVITKRGTPVAMLVPYEEKPVSLFGYMKDTLSITGDIVEMGNEDWDAENE